MRAWCIIWFALVTFTTSGQTAGEIIERYIQITSGGDPEVWKSIRSASIESLGGYSSTNFSSTQVEPELMPPSYSRHLILWPDKSKIDYFEDSTFQNRTSSFYFLKDKMVILMNNMPVIIKPPSEDHFFEFVPARIQRLTARNKSLVLKGEEFFKKDSVTCHRIDLTFEGVSYQLYFDKSTGLLRYSKSSNMASDDILVEFPPYRKYGPIMIPGGEVMTRGGVPYFWNKILRVDINPVISPAEFVYPPKD